MLGLAEASERVLERLRLTGSERVPLEDAAGRVLAGAVISPVTLPPWDNSAMDGYAVRAADVATANRANPRKLRVIDSIPAGGFPSRGVGQGEASRIMTGAPVPEGADSVVRVEDTNGGTEEVLVHDGRDAERNVRRRGEDVVEGTAVLRQGSWIGPGAAAMLAAVGQATVEVARRPRVAIFGSGDELVPVDRIDEVRAGRRIVATNGYAIAAVVRVAGGIVLDLGIAPDDRGAITGLFERAAREADLIVTSAGVSVGAHDYTRSVVESLGTVAQWRIAARPGSQLAFGDVRGVPWLGLPGNPVSAVITAELFVRAAVLRMQGAHAVYPAPIEVRLVQSVAMSNVAQLLRARVHADATGWVATLTGPQGSSLLSSIADATVLVVVPAGTGEIGAGSPLAALPIGSSPTMAARLATTLAGRQPHE